MENLKWEIDDNGVLHMYADVAQLKIDNEEMWRLDSYMLGLKDCYIEFDEVYNEEEAKAYVEGMWNSDDLEGDF